LGDISSWATPKPWWSLLYSTIVLYDNHCQFATKSTKPKAFDTVPHNRLRYKLQWYGVAGNIYQWISSFLNEHYQQVVKGNVSSDLADDIILYKQIISERMYNNYKILRENTWLLKFSITKCHILQVTRATTIICTIYH